MKARALLLGAVASIALADAANAGHFKGWYVGLEAGANQIGKSDAVLRGQTSEGFSITTTGTIDYDNGWAVFATVGHSFDMWRLEGEVGYRSNDASDGFAEVTELSFMLNALVDLDLSHSLSLSLGAGAGYDITKFRPSGFPDDEDGNFAYQGIAGLNYALSERTDLTLTYRYLIVQGPDFSVAPGELAVDDLQKQSLTIGLRYDLYPDEEPMAAPPPPPPPPPAMPFEARSFLIFFGFGKCNITSEANAVLGEAAAAAKAGGSVAIRVVGHTDTVGSDKANKKLSECRANAAKDNLIGKGVPGDIISASGKGEGDLQVKTGDNVKEPQNRRVTIDL